MSDLLTDVTNYLKHVTDKRFDVEGTEGIYERWANDIVLMCNRAYREQMRHEMPSITTTPADRLRIHEGQ